MTQLGVGCFCKQDLLCSVTIWCMLGGSLEVRTKKFLHWFDEGQTHFGIPRVANVSLALNAPN